MIRRRTDMVEIHFEEKRRRYSTFFWQKGLTSKQWGELLTAPLELVVHEGNRDLAQTLVRAGAEMGESLITAVERGHGEIVNDLLENGAYTDAKWMCLA